MWRGQALGCFSQLLPLLLLLDPVLTEAAGSVPQEEIAGLHSLYVSTGGDSWRFRSPLLWDFTQDGAGQYINNPCFLEPFAMPWEGLRCTGQNQSLGCDEQTCHVTSINFFYFGLVGSLPSDLSKISRLQEIVILGNDLFGEIPASIGNITELQKIDFAFNLLTSSIPDSITQLVGLTALTLWENQISGHLPFAIGELEKIVEIDVDSNNLSGPLPSSIGKLKKIESFWFTENAISGSLPPEIGGESSLQFLGLHGNMMTGPIPIEFGNLSNLEYLDLAENSLSGTLPIEISGLMSIQEMWLDSNFITGCIPPLGMLEVLDTLALSKNEFVCGLPEGLVNLTKLTYVHLNENELSGSIPVDIGNLKLVSSIGLYQNKLTGSIPPSMGLLSSLNYVGLFNNLFSGSIPATFGHLEKLVYLGAGTNMLTGSIPVEVCRMGILDTIEFLENQLTGSLPSCMGNNNSLLSTIAMQNNFLTGTIPPSFGNLSKIHTFSLGTNHITGTLSDDIGLLSVMTIFDVSVNFLSGSLPGKLSELSALERLNMAGNLFSGELNDKLNSSHQLALTVLDMSNNRLSGQLPDTLFQFPNIETIALSVNCFGGSLPSAMCDATSIEVFSMDGLGAAQSCKDSFILPITGVALFNFIEGTIPSCIWSFPNIRVLHFSGNGLGGTLEPLPNNTTLEHLALAHNTLSGTIPRSVRDVHHLDLAYNAITGDFESYGVAVNDTGISLHVNRLSGPLSNEMANVADLRILEGNLFGCDTSIPENDIYYKEFLCGSKSLDNALYGMGFLCACTALLIVGYNIFKREVFSTMGPPIFAKIHFRALRQKFFLENLKRKELFFLSHYKELSNIVLFGRKLHALWVFVFRISVLSFVFGIPILLVKRSEEMSGDFYYSTHTHTYRWFWTFAYISGQLPAVLILVAWMVVISLFTVYFLWIFPMKTSFQEEKGILEFIREKISMPEEEVSEREVPPLTTKNKVKLAAAIVLNVFIIVVMNAVYIYSSDQDLDSNSLLAIQFEFAIFNVMYGLIVLPIFASPIDDEMGNINFRLWLLKFNNLFVPCVVTFLSSTSCMQGLLVESDAITSHYSHTECDFWYYADISQSGGRECIEYSEHDVDVVPLVPPYVYHYQCGSIFLKLYIPVYIYMYSFQLLIPFIYMMFLSLLEYETIPKAMRPMVPAIIWPKYILKNYINLNNVTLKDETENVSAKLTSHAQDSREDSQEDFDIFLVALKKNPSMLFNTKTVITFDICHNLSILLTFGLCSPFLTVIISLAMILKINMWLIFMGRFLNFFYFDGEECTSDNQDNNEADVNLKISQHKEQILVKKDNIHPALVALTVVCFPLEEVFRKSVWTITWNSAAFFAFLCWDLSADKLGWRRAIWIPCLALSFPLVMWIVMRIVRNWGTRLGNLFVTRQESNSSDADIELSELVSKADV